MKLRNKKTGEIVEALISACGISGDVVVSVMDSKSEDGYKDLGRYGTLAEVNDEWEDYKPKEPLIKDEKVRKAVRAWAEAIDLRWFKRCVSVNPHTTRLYGQDARGIGYTIELKPNELYGDLIDKKGYTLTEVCGDEEE